eukprot:Nk52_evm1s323 gene=Nk52_evmTU1s323
MGLSRVASAVPLDEAEAVLPEFVELQNGFRGSALHKTLEREAKWRRDDDDVFFYQPGSLPPDSSGEKVYHSDCGKELVGLEKSFEDSNADPPPGCVTLKAHETTPAKIYMHSSSLTGNGGNWNAHLSSVAEDWILLSQYMYLMQIGYEKGQKHYALILSVTGGSSGTGSTNLINALLSNTRLPHGRCSASQSLFNFLGYSADTDSDQDKQAWEHSFKHHVLLTPCQLYAMGVALRRAALYADIQPVDFWTVVPIALKTYLSTSKLGNAFGLNPWKDTNMFNKGASVTMEEALALFLTNAAYAYYMDVSQAFESWFVNNTDTNSLFSEDWSCITRKPEKFGNYISVMEEKMTISPITFKDGLTNEQKSLIAKMFDMAVISTDENSGSADVSTFEPSFPLCRRGLLTDPFLFKWTNLEVEYSDDSRQQTKQGLLTQTEFDKLSEIRSQLVQQSANAYMERLAQERGYSWTGANKAQEDRYEHLFNSLNAYFKDNDEVSSATKSRREQHWNIPAMMQDYKTRAKAESQASEESKEGGKVRGDLMMDAAALPILPGFGGGVFSLFYENMDAAQEVQSGSVDFKKGVPVFITNEATARIIARFIENYHKTIFSKHVSQSDNTEWERKKERRGGKAPGKTEKDFVKDPYITEQLREENHWLSTLVLMVSGKEFADGDGAPHSSGVDMAYHGCHEPNYMPVSLGTMSGFGFTSMYCYDCPFPNYNKVKDIKKSILTNVAEIEEAFEAASYNDYQKKVCNSYAGATYLDHDLGDESASSWPTNKCTNTPVYVDIGGYLSASMPGLAQMVYMYAVQKKIRSVAKQAAVNFPVNFHPVFHLFAWKEERSFITQWNMEVFLEEQSVYGYRLWLKAHRELVNLGMGQTANNLIAQDDLKDDITLYDCDQDLYIRTNYYTDNSLSGKLHSTYGLGNPLYVSPSWPLIFGDEWILARPQGYRLVYKTVNNVRFERKDWFRVRGDQVKTASRAAIDLGFESAASGDESSLYSCSYYNALSSYQSLIGSGKETEPSNKGLYEFNYCQVSSCAKYLSEPDFGEEYNPINTVGIEGFDQ